MIFDGYRVGVLCEDRMHRDFIRGFLGVLGIEDRKISLVEELPEGKMSGEQFVRVRFPVALKEYARARENKFLAVAQDVDQKDRSPEDMRDCLNNVAERNPAVADSVKEDDKILFVFPKRNVETWIRWLNAADTDERANVTEDKDYKTGNRVKPKEAGKKAGELYQKRRNSSENVLPSLGYMYNSLDSLRKCLGV